MVESVSSKAALLLQQTDSRVDLKTNIKFEYRDAKNFLETFISNHAKEQQSMNELRKLVPKLRESI